ncbi:MAG: FIST N-terminal domain-containing protein, partial [Acidobacteriota bacterium]
MKTKTRSISISSPFVADDLSALDSEQTLVVVFGPSQMLDDSNLISSVADAFPHSHLIGCSTSGEIVGTTISDNTLAIGVCRFSDSELKTTVAPVASSADSFGAGEMIARELAGPSLRSVFVLSDGLNVNGSELVRGLNSVLPEEVVVTGGLAGDGDRFVRTWVLSGGRPMSGHVCAVGLSGDRLLVGHGSKGGWDIFGPERRVTRSKGNILYELDGKPALEIYKQYLGDRASGLPSTALRFPLALRYDKDAEKQVVRTILGVDEDSQAMVFAGDVPEGCFAQ